MAKIKNNRTGEVVDVVATTNHPDSSYGQEVWVDAENIAYGIVGYPLLGYELVHDRHHAVEMIATEMRNNDISIYKLSKLSGVSQPTISGILRGDNSPSLDTLDKICDALNLKITIEENNNKNMKTTIYKTSGYQKIEQQVKMGLEEIEVRYSVTEYDKDPQPGIDALDTYTCIWAKNFDTFKQTCQDHSDRVINFVEE